VSDGREDRIDTAILDLANRVWLTHPTAILDAELSLLAALFFPQTIQLSATDASSLSLSLCLFLSLSLSPSISHSLSSTAAILDAWSKQIV
jgi:hypothetical protein